MHCDCDRIVNMRNAKNDNKHKCNNSMMCFANEMHEKLCETCLYDFVNE